MTQIPNIVQGISSQARLEAALEIGRNIGGAVPPLEATPSASPASAVSTQPVLPPPAEEFQRGNPAGLPSLAGLSPPAAASTGFQTLLAPQRSGIVTEQVQVYPASSQLRPAADASSAQINTAGAMTPAASSVAPKPPAEINSLAAKPAGEPAAVVKGLPALESFVTAASLAAASSPATTPSAAMSGKIQAQQYAGSLQAERQGAVSGLPAAPTGPGANMPANPASVAASTPGIAPAHPLPAGLAATAAQILAPAQVAMTVGTSAASANLVPATTLPIFRASGAGALEGAIQQQSFDAQPFNPQSGADAVNASATSRALAAVVAQLGNPSLLDWTARQSLPVAPASSLPARTGTEAMTTGQDSPLRKAEGTAIGFGASASIAAAKSEKGLDDGYGKPASGQTLSAGAGRETAALQNVKYGLGADIGVSHDPAATGLAPSSLFGGEPSPALNGSSIPGVVLNAAMIPGWPQQRPYANSPGEGNVKAGQTTGPAMTDEEILAYLVNFGADEKMLARAKKMLATPVAGKKLMTFLAVMMTAMSTVLRTVKDELEAMLAEQEEEKQHESAHHSLAGQRLAKRARLFLK